ncbi:Histidyl-tRNA synthetase [Giardia lamblia P15]|uniref:Histidyl-tRNA synthetase n=1 Tax=Giardia intestinalis (strain P15) TaxID=658858 RepID=E1F1I4_GIAIA|nr:Histidyl-tRNA synthetase [Giardia lamblia P15]
MLSMVELGGASLTLEGFYNVCYCRAPVVLDASVFAAFPSASENPASRAPYHYATLFSGKYRSVPYILSRAYIFTMLSLLVNSPASVSITVLQGLTRILNDSGDITLQRPECVLLPNSTLERDLLDQLLSIITESPDSPFYIELSDKDINTFKLNTHAFTLSVSFASSILLSFVATLHEAALSFSFELMCAKVRELFESVNYTVQRKHSGMKTAMSNVLSLISGSKKVTQKGSNLFCSQSLSLAGEIRGLATDLRTAVRSDTASAAYTSFDTRPLTDVTALSLLHSVQLKLATIQSMSIARRHLVDSVSVEKGIWKAPSDNAYEVAENKMLDALRKEPVPVLHALLLPVQLCSVLKDLSTELLSAFTKLSTAQAELSKGKIQVGQGILLAMDTYGDLFTDYQSASGAHQFWCISRIVHAMTDHLFLAVSNARIPQPPCGMRDLLPGQMALRQTALSLITSIFQQHGALCIETPVMESRSVLMGKYGEEQKLIYNVSDYGEEPLSLRYDLTVPFARYCATHREKSIKRYSIGRVYRRDKPVIEKGRFREFYQCDLDIVYEPNTQAPMAADAEVVVIVFEILNALRKSIRNFEILINHRGILDSAMAVAGVSDEQKKAVCSCIDQLDKHSKEEVRDKIVKSKGLTPVVADIVLALIDFKLPTSPHMFISPSFDFTSTAIAALKEMHASASLDSTLSSQFIDAISPKLEQLGLLFRYASLMCPQSLECMVLDFSLTRGLDYYTGMVFEAKLISDYGERTGSIAGGGRYDELLGKFRARGDELCAVGGSIGIERIFAILEARQATLDGLTVGGVEDDGSSCKLTSAKRYDVYICGAPGCTIEARLEVAGILWGLGISVGVSHKEGCSQKLLKKDIDEGVAGHALLALIIGGDEIESRVINVKNLETTEQIVVPFDEIGEYCSKVLAARHERFALSECEKLLKDIKDGKDMSESIDNVLAAIKTLRAQHK